MVFFFEAECCGREVGSIAGQLIRRRDERALVRLRPLADRAFRDEPAPILTMVIFSPMDAAGSTSIGAVPASGTSAIFAIK